MEHAIDFLRGKERRLKAEIKMFETSCNPKGKEVCIRQLESIEKAIKALSK